MHEFGDVDVDSARHFFEDRRRFAVVEVLVEKLQQPRVRWFAREQLARERRDLLARLQFRIRPRVEDRLWRSAVEQRELQRDENLMLRQSPPTVLVERPGSEFQPIDRFGHEQRNGQRRASRLSSTMCRMHLVIELSDSREFVLRRRASNRPMEHPIHRIRELLWRRIAIGMQDREEPVRGLRTSHGIEFAILNFDLRPTFDNLLSIAQHDLGR